MTEENNEWGSFLEYFVADTQRFSIKDLGESHDMFCFIFKEKHKTWTLAQIKESLYFEKNLTDVFLTNNDNFKNGIKSLHDNLEAAEKVVYTYCKDGSRRVEPLRSVWEQLDKEYPKWKAANSTKKKKNPPPPHPFEEQSIAIITPEDNSEFFKNPLFQAAISVWLESLSYGETIAQEEVMNLFSADLDSSNTRERRLPIEEIASGLVSRQIFRDLTGAKAFLMSKCECEEEKETSTIKKIECINSFKKLVSESPNGQKLKAKIEDRISTIQLIDKHRKTIEDFVKLIKHSDRSISSRGMTLCYEIFQSSYTPKQMNSFARSDFGGNPFWRKFLFSDLEQIANHLQTANIYIGNRLADILKTDLTQQNLLEDSSKNLTIKIVEGGVGGTDTAYQVIRHILEKFESKEPKIEINEIQYQGFEIEGINAICAELILKALSPLSGEIRHQFFQSIQNKIKPLLNESSFVIPKDVQVGINDIVREHCNSIDIFICSYAFHHIPNGLTLYRKLFDFTLPEDRRITYRSREGREFFDDFLTLLEAKKIGKIPTYRLRDEVNVINSFLAPDLRNKEIEEIIKDTERVINTSNGCWNKEPHWAKKMIVNPQRTFLRRVKEILRPNGLIAIADPDGFSSFNKENLPKNPEMGVAHFLNIISIQELLSEIGFEILDCKTQFKQDDGGFGEENPIDLKRNFKNHGLIDPNMGYIIIAKKPSK